MTDRTLFDVLDEPNVTGMVHHDDPPTSVDAAAVILRRVTELHGQVLEAVRRYGPMTDEALEQLPEFREFGPSTIRKRRSELYQMHRLEAVGERRNSRGRKMLLWHVVALLLVAIGCALPLRRICADGWPIKILQDPQCVRGVCGYTCAPDRWRPEPNGTP